MIVSGPEALGNSAEGEPRRSQSGQYFDIFDVVQRGGEEEAEGGHLGRSAGALSRKHYKGTYGDWRDR
jgi:hypothetical protein